MRDKHLLIVYHSQSETTTRMAKAVIRGATHADADDLLWADGLILGTPENFALRPI